MPHNRRSQQVFPRVLFPLVVVGILAAGLIPICVQATEGPGAPEKATVASRQAQPGPARRTGRGKHARGRLGTSARPPIPSEMGEMDPKLAEALNAFGSSRYDESRRLAEALLAAGRDSAAPGGHGNACPTADTIAECVGLIILSHLNQGGSDAARKETDRLRSISPDVCEDLLDQVNRDERDYQARVAPFQQMVATTKNPKEAARAQLQIARANQVFGRLELAEQYYREEIKRSPAGPEAVRAVSHLALLAIERREYARGVKQMEEVARRYLKTPAALKAHTAIPRIHLAQGKLDRAIAAYSAITKRYPKTEAAVEAQFAIARIYQTQGEAKRAVGAYSAIAKRYPGTETAAKAQYAIGEIHQQRGETEEAEAAYLATARTYRDSPVSHQAREALVEMYYTRGKAAMTPGWNPATLQASLEAYRKGVHVDLDRDRKSKYSLHVAQLYANLQKWEEARRAAREVLKLDPPDDPEFAKRRRAARLSIASYYHQERLLEEALAGFESLLAESTEPEEKQTLAITIAGIESELHPNPLYVETPHAELKEAR